MAGHPLFTIDIVTPESIIWSGEAEFVSAMTTEGEIGVYAAHEPTMAALSTGAVEIHTEEGMLSVGIHGGFLQIFQNSVTLLTDRAEMTEGGRVEALRLAEGMRDDSPEDASETGE
ncbi:ATP synthase epsilon chain [bacterium BMS3Bbin02]|nr:ATP synthase epsilon chain [bacterium BMS3Bbin02]